MKRVVMAVILVIMLFPFTACEGELPPSGEIIDNIIEAMGSAESYRVEGDMTAQLYFMAEEMPNFFPLDMEITANIEGDYDLVNKEVEITGEAGFAGPDEEPIKIEMAIYLVDEVVYLRYDMPIISPYWMKLALPPELAKMIFQGGKQQGIFKMGDIEVIGEARKGGKNCYLLQVNTDLKGILGFLLQAAQLPYEEMLEGEMAELDQISSDITVKIWVDKDDYYIVSESYEVSFEVTPEMMGEYDEEGSFSLNATVNTRYYDYNKKVEITLPPEAENVEEMNLW